MPTLNWSGKDKLVNYSTQVPYHVLNHVYNFGGDTENKIIHGDDRLIILAMKAGFNDKVNSPQIQKWIGQVVGREGEDFSRQDKWLCMMYPRLKLLKRLFADDDTIFIFINDNELFNLKFVCD